MPRYEYRCDQCKDEFITSHSINETITDCILCKTKDSLIRIPSSFFAPRPPNKQNKKPGTLVKQFIENAKKEIKEEKKQLHDKEYK